MNTLTTETRREKIKEMLQKTDHPVTASSLAEHFSVSRQIIVGDIALLRASGLQILATPRGYLMDSPSVQEDKNLGILRSSFGTNYTPSSMVAPQSLTSPSNIHCTESFPVNWISLPAMM